MAHIVHLVTRLLRAGSEENTMSTCLWQAEQGHRVTVLHGLDFDWSWYDRPTPGVDLIWVHEMVHPIRPRKDLHALLTIRSLLRVLRPDVVHTHQSKAGILGRLAAAWLPNCRVVHGIHILPFDGVSSGKRRLYLTAERLVARFTDRFIAVSKSVGKRYVDEGICAQDRVECVYSGMALDPFRWAEPPSDAAHIAGPGAGPVVVMLAAMEERKRHIALLRAMAPVLRQRPGMRLVLAGDGPEAQAIQREITEQRLTEQVRLCGHRKDPDALLAMASLSVLVSEREGLPRVAVQSMAAGVPMVITDLPGIDEIIQNGVNGRVTNSSDLTETARVIAELLSNPVELARLRHGAKATDVSQWSLHALGENTTKSYGLAS